MVDVSMNATSGQGPDPYQLDRLADDLAFREARRGHQGNGSISSGRHELPVLVPLSHDHPLLSSSVPFNVDAFLLSRPNTLLSDLRTELREYLANLKEELVQLINDDYAAFISLRAELRGEGPRLERLQSPLSLVKGEINVCKIPLHVVSSC
jgi:conserved oligomeric Golgi complex subunit 2